jgi:hypothetical protein
LKSSETIASEALVRADILQRIQEKLTELIVLSIKKYNSPEFESHLNILSHSYYAQFDSALNKVGSNNQPQNHILI